MATNEEIDEFWNWFRDLSEYFASSARSEDAEVLSRLLGPRVEALIPGAKWEVGPGTKSVWSFALSPNGSKQRLFQTKKAVSRAPLIPNWEFCDSKPVKKWQLRFEIWSAAKGKVLIDASSWRYFLTSYKGGEFYDLTIVMPSILHITRNERDHAAMVVAEGVLGERSLIEFFGRVTSVALSESQRNADSLSPIKVLADHVRSLTGNRQAKESEKGESEKGSSLK